MVIRPCPVSERTCVSRGTLANGESPGSSESLGRVAEKIASRLEAMQHGGMKPIPLRPVITAVAAGLAGGYLWGRSTRQAAPEPRAGLSKLPDHKADSAGFRKRSNMESAAADSLAALLENTAGMAAGALEDELRAARRDAVPGDGEAVLRQQLLLYSLARVDAARALRVARELDLRSDGSATALVLAAMAVRDPRGAAALVSGGNGLTTDPHAALSAIGVAAAWARQDAPAAQQWVRTLPDGLRAEAWSAVASVMAAAHPAEAAAFTLEMPPGAARAHGCARVAEVWARAAPQESLSWAASLPLEERFAAAPAALGALAQNDPAAAAAWLLRQPPKDHLPQNTAALMGTWARGDPAAAAEWVAGIPSNTVQAEAMPHLLYQWTASQPEQASAWLRAQPASPARDEAAAMLSLQVSATDPEAAAVWAASISDPDRRSVELHRSLSSWLRRDEDDAAAREWMEEAGVSVP